MPSSYSTNLKIELQATGENSGTWGTITNTNLGTALEQAVVGYGNPSYASDANLTLTYTDTNAAQAARALVLNVTSAVSLTVTRELVVPTIQKQYIVQNNTTGSQSITVKTSGGTGITVTNGRKAHLYVNGTDVIFMDDFVDINGGTIDGTVIGGAAAAAGTFTTATATTGNITTVNATTVDTTNIEVTNLKAKDGTAAGSIADSTGVVTLASSVLTTTDINGGTIDGTTIGGSSAAAGSFSTLTTSSTVTLNGGTANGVAFLNASKVVTSGTGLVFDGTNLGIGTASPGAKLDISGSDATCQAIIMRRGIKPTISGAQASILCELNGIGTAESMTFMADAGYKWLDDAGTAEWMRLNSSGNLGIGTASPAYKLDVAGIINSSSDIISQGNDARISLYRSAGINFFDFASGQSLYFSTQTSAGGAGRSTKMVLTDAGNLGIGTTSPGNRVSVNDPGTGLGFSNAASGNFNLGLLAGTGSAVAYVLQRANADLLFGTNDTERARITAAGRLGIATTIPEVDLQIGANTSTTRALSVRYSSVPLYLSGGFDGTNALSTFSTNAYANATGSGQSWTSFSNVSYCASAIQLASSTSGADIRFLTAAASNTNPTERARITAAGVLLVGQTTNALADVGHILDPLGIAYHITNGITCLTVNRKTSDGTLVDFMQDGVSEGTISVSGATVSYNAFAGSHWSQLQDNSKPDILRGTVMESINELCVWPGEQNERLPKSKVSDTAGSKKVYGVFMAWDNDWTTTNDMYITAVGAFICRVNGSVTVQEGDLLESNGDGTARVQADDIIRSSTIGKVTSTVKTHQYADGSYCVPTVLYCG